MCLHNTITLPEVTDKTKDADAHDHGYNVIGWNDPINTMQYVIYVFQQIFGWDEQKATKHMLEIHEKGQTILVQENLEKAELYVHELQKHQLTATLEPAK